MTIRLNTEKEIKDFLLLIRNKHKIKENTDPYTSDYNNKYEGDTSLYGQLKAEKQTEEENEEVEIEEEEEETEDDSPSGIHASFDSLVRAVNDLRSGKSITSGDIKKEVTAYYDSLDEDERNLLVLFMRELGDILTGEEEGRDAQVPSEPPTNWDIEKEKVNKPIKKQKIVKNVEKEVEDITPPIKVNESQDLTINKKQFDILSRR
jgi:hypothetical protein